MSPTLYTKNIGDASSTLYLAQSFVAGFNDSIYSIDLKIAKHNNPSSTVTLYIYSDSGGNPGTNLSGSGQVLSASVPADSPAGWEGTSTPGTGTGWTNQIFNPSTVLLNGTTYWLVMKVSSSNSAKYWTVVRSQDDTTYPSGTAKVGNALTSLTALSYDMAFRIRVGGIFSTLSIPTVGGNAYSHIINASSHSGDTVVTGHAFYQAVDDVEANAGAEECKLTPGTYCHPSSVDQPPQNFPISESQITQMESQAAAGGTITCSPTCTILDGSSIGPKKYVGNLLIDNHATVTLTGTVWVQGNITMDNGATLKLTAGYGTNSGEIIADDPTNPTTEGTILLRNDGNLQGNGTSGTYVMAISMNSDPSFTTPAIDVSNNLTNGVLYAPNGLVNISNNAKLSEVTAMKIHLAENTEITYSTGLASIIFSSGPGGSWKYQKGTYQIL